MSVVSEGRDQIREAVHEYILAEFLPGEDPENLTETTPLITGGILDSIDTAKLIHFLEEKYGVHYEAHEVTVDHLDTIHLIVESLERKLR